LQLPPAPAGTPRDGSASARSAFDLHPWDQSTALARSRQAENTLCRKAFRYAGASSNDLRRTDLLGRRGTLLLFAHGTYEVEALAKHGVDEALLLAIVADCAPGRIDAGAQCRLRNQPPIPDRGEQVILADDVFPVADQIFQDVEDLRLERNQTGAVPQLAPLGIEEVSIE
jgi:hypothetical protein